MGSSYSVEVAAMNAMMGFIVMIVFVCLAGVAAQVLLGLATYNDAKARGNNDPVMWGLLVGILGWIPGIVYLCLRNNNANRLMTCPQCGFVHRVAEPFCPQCRVQNPYSAPFQNPLAHQQAHRAKLLLIWAVFFKRETGRSPAGMEKIGTGRTIYVTGDGPDKDL